MKSRTGCFGYCCFLFLLLVHWGNTNGQAPGLKIQKLTENFYVYTTYKVLDGNPFPSNSMYCVTDSGIVLLDTPWDSAQFQPLVDSIRQRHNKPIICCIVTHYHDDRTAGLAHFQKLGIPTWSSYQTYALGSQHAEHTARYHFFKDTIFSFAGKKIHTFYPGPGHTADNIVLWIPESRIVYGGCLVKSMESKGLGNIADANLKKWPKSIKKVMKKYPDRQYVIPGHFGWHGRNSLEHTLVLLKVRPKKK